MHGLQKGRVPIGLGLLVGGVLLFQQSAYAGCVQDKKAYGGKTAACAFEICSYEDCIKNAKGSGFTQENDSGWKAKEDPGAARAAIAACQPYIQVMQQCQTKAAKINKHAPAPSQKQTLRCRDGRDYQK